MSAKLGAKVSCTLMLLATTVCPRVHADPLADPMRPGFAPTKSSASTVRSAPAAARLTAVFVSGERRVAVFDGRVVKAGDRVGDVSILEITTDGIRVMRSGRVEVMRLPKQAAAVRSPVKAEQRESIAKEMTP